MCQYLVQRCILAWQTMLPNGVQIFLHKKIISNFLRAKSGVFCESSAKNMVWNGTTQIFNQTRPHLMNNSQLLCISKLPRYFSPFKRFPASFIESRSNLNYMYVIICSNFFQKSFLGTQVVITWEIQWEFTMIQPFGMNGHADNFEHIFKTIEENH